MKLNKMLVLTALTAGGLVASGSAFASVPSTTANATSKISNEFGGGNSYVDKMSQKLGLSASQKEKVKSLFGRTHQQMSDVKENTSLTADEKKSKMSEIKDSTNTKMKSILTPEQYQKWQKWTESTHLSMPHGTPSMPSRSPQ